MDDDALQTGLLLDLAKQQHETAEAALQRLTEHTRALDDTLRDAIRRALIAELGALQSELDDALGALQTVHRTARKRAIWMTPLFAALGAALGIFPVLVFVPSRAEIARRRATVSALDARGGAIHLKHCTKEDGTSHLCVRIDKAAGGFGPAGRYYLIQ